MMTNILRRSGGYGRSKYRYCLQELMINSPGHHDKTFCESSIKRFFSFIYEPASFTTQEKQLALKLSPKDNQISGKSQNTPFASP